MSHGIDRPEFRCINTRLLLFVTLAYVYKITLYVVVNRHFVHSVTFTSTACNVALLMHIIIRFIHIIINRVS